MTPYEILGVSPGASQDEIKSAFRAKAKKCHPDVRWDKAQAEKEFKELNDAFEKAKNGWKPEKPKGGRYDWHDPYARGSEEYKDEPVRKTWKRKEQPEIELKVETIRIVTFNTSNPTLAEKQCDSWHRDIYFASMPFEEDVYLHVTVSRSVTVKLPKGTVTGSKFKFKHPDQTGIMLTIRAIHDKFKGL
jgi:curved DNA-binding protein CbpA